MSRVTITHDDITASVDWPDCPLSLSPDSSSTLINMIADCLQAVGFSNELVAKFVAPDGVDLEES